jgi:FtsZ-interacting cell division protein ZipA
MSAAWNDSLAGNLLADHKGEVLMSTGLIIVIVVVAIILIALVAFVMPRMRRQAQVRARERELEQRREHVADEHRAEAQERSRQADLAEQKARMAETEAKRERAEAELHEQRAQTHESGMADHELVRDDEREKFAGTSAMPDEPGRPLSGDRPMHEPGTTTDYEQGRRDEAEGRFSRAPETEGERVDEPTTGTPRRDY